MEPMLPRSPIRGVPLKVLVSLSFAIVVFFLDLDAGSGDGVTGKSDAETTIADANRFFNLFLQSPTTNDQGMVNFQALLD